MDFSPWGNILYIFTYGSARGSHCGDVGLVTLRALLFTCCYDDSFQGSCLLSIPLVMSNIFISSYIFGILILSHLVLFWKHLSGVLLSISLFLTLLNNFIGNVSLLNVNMDFKKNYFFLAKSPVSFNRNKFEMFLCYKKVQVYTKENNECPSASKTISSHQFGWIWNRVF